MEGYKRGPQAVMLGSPLYTSGARDLGRLWLWSSLKSPPCVCPEPQALEPTSCPCCLLASSPVAARAWPGPADLTSELGPLTALLLWLWWYPTQADTPWGLPSMAFELRSLVAEFAYQSHPGGTLALP